VELGANIWAVTLKKVEGLLKLLPFWDPLRSDPRSEKIVASLAPD
jgi:hypothetical protein